MTNRRGFCTALMAAGLGGFSWAQAQEKSLWDTIVQRGSLKVAVYEDYAPYFSKGVGIEADLANALATKLGLKLTLLPFKAGENLNDDLRNMVWKGHYLGYGPADVMLHVPIDKMLMRENEKVFIFSPYYRQTVRVAYDGARFNQLNDLSQLKKEESVGVSRDGMAATLLLGKNGGQYKDQIRIYNDLSEAVSLLKEGKLAAVVGDRAEIESLDKGEPKLTIDPVPFLPILPKGWAVGMAVKKDEMVLAHKLDDALTALVSSGELSALFKRNGVNYIAP